MLGFKSKLTCEVSKMIPIFEFLFICVIFFQYLSEYRAPLSKVLYRKWIANLAWFYSSMCSNTFNSTSSELSRDQRSSNNINTRQNEFEHPDKMEFTHFDIFEM